MVVFLSWQLALFIVSHVLKGYLHTGREETSRPKASVCTWPSLSHCRAKALQVQYGALLTKFHCASIYLVPYDALLN